MKLERLSDVITYPVSLAEIKSQLRITDTDNDSFLTSLIPVCTSYCETVTGRAFISQQWRLWLDKWESVVELPFPPAISIEQIKYLDANKVWQTLAVTDYDADLKDCPAKIRINEMPSLYDCYNNAYVDMTCGYGDYSSDVPSYARQAILMLVGHYYYNRQDIIISYGGGPPIALVVPKAVDALLLLVTPGRFLIS
jgi:uncharacterized phiE125 gp8 family phage protein